MDNLFSSSSQSLGLFFSPFVDAVSFCVCGIGCILLEKFDANMEHRCNMSLSCCCRCKLRELLSMGQFVFQEFSKTLAHFTGNSFQSLSRKHCN